MTSNLKNFLEQASKDKEFIEKLNKADTPEAVIALAAEKGFSLTPEDLKNEPAAGSLDDSEVEAVTGGDKCYCFAGGGGEALGDERTCACVMYGQGDMEDGGTRCTCALGGTGVDWAEGWGKGMF